MYHFIIWRHHCWAKETQFTHWLGHLHQGLILEYLFFWLSFGCSQKFVRCGSPKTHLLSIGHAGSKIEDWLCMLVYGCFWFPFRVHVFWRGTTKKPKQKGCLQNGVSPSVSSWMWCLSTPKNPQSFGHVQFASSPEEYPVRLSGWSGFQIPKQHIHKHPKKKHVST